MMNKADVQVYRGSYYDANKNPKSNGLIDNHMGCMEKLHWRNNPLIMSEWCGSIGSPMNITQMVPFVGQQSVGFISRSLPHFPINAKTPSAKGFVANSFCSGLSATEFFFHTMGGREGLVDTAVVKCVESKKSPRSGSILITLDKEKIDYLRLDINTHTVKESILRTQRIKLKGEHIKVLDGRKLEVIPPSDKGIFHFHLDSLLKKLSKIVVQGISTVECAVISKSDKADEYQLVVSGSGLKEVMAMEGVDGLKTTSNHILELQQVIGIEAARKCIIDVIKFIMEKHNMTIDQRHMMLLADVMTYKGENLGITRFGAQKMKESVLSMASFEKTADILFNASVNGRRDLIEGVSESIIMGVQMRDD